MKIWEGINRGYVPPSEVVAFIPKKYVYLKFHFADGDFADEVLVLWKNMSLTYEEPIPTHEPPIPGFEGLLAVVVGGIIILIKRCC